MGLWQKEEDKSKIKMSNSSWVEGWYYVLLDITWRCVYFLLQFVRWVPAKSE